MLFPAQDFFQQTFYVIAVMRALKLALGSRKNHLERNGLQEFSFQVISFQRKGTQLLPLLKELVNRFTTAEFVCFSEFFHFFKDLRL